MARTDGRANDELRPVRFETNYTMHAPGSVLVEFGRTRVLCTAMVEPRVPNFLMGSGKGWLTAEYAMLPSSTNTRKKRENYKNGPDGRSVEIGRLIGRSLRDAVDLSRFGERQIIVDCDVIQADGGTRTAAITGGYVAVALALYTLNCADRCLKPPVSAVSCGVVGGVPMLDLCYVEDSSAEADVNVVMSNGGFIEVQDTGEKRPVGKEELLSLLELAEKGNAALNKLQQKAIDDWMMARLKEEMARKK